MKRYLTDSYKKRKIGCIKLSSIYKKAKVKNITSRSFHMAQEIPGPKIINNKDQLVPHLHAAPRESRLLEPFRQLITILIMAKVLFLLNPHLPSVSKFFNVQIDHDRY